jgi:hypothetical protein
MAGTAMAGTRAEVFWKIPWEIPKKSEKKNWENLKGKSLESLFNKIFFKLRKGFLTNQTIWKDGAGESKGNPTARENNHAWSVAKKFSPLGTTGSNHVH